MKNYNMILTEKQQKYQHYHQVKLVNVNTVTVEEILPSDQSTIIEKAFEKQLKTIEDQGIKQVEALKALKLEKNKQDIESIDGIFQKR